MRLCTLWAVTLSVCIITYNEEQNIGRTLAGVQELVRAVDGEIIIVDSGSTDRTREIAGGYGAKVFVEPWKGFAAQKNSAIEKAGGEWVLLLDADEEVSPELSFELQKTVLGPQIAHKFRQTLPDGTQAPIPINGFLIPRKNHFLGRWIRHGGFWPDPKLRLFRRGTGRVVNRAVHEVVEVTEWGNRTISVVSPQLQNPLIHHAYPTLAGYLEHMNRYSSLGAGMRGPSGFSLVNIVLRPMLTFVYNYIFRLGFLDGREGLLLHLYHAGYVSWKYAKAWELGRNEGYSQ